ncbi:MAG: alpha-glucosidase [Myxococcota bacterium]|nr:alpha-glucosidase [Myxococcota bacterium]
MDKKTTDWWRSGTIYQIYPRSFSDSGARGWGDLNGIRERLPYLASLGVDALWISPFFLSPMKDFGYDVEDHRRVDPMFGTNEDLDALIREARDLDLKIMVDLVLSHVADTHPWFQDTIRNPDSEYSDCFVWAEPSADGCPPNNWLSVFGGSAWSWNSRRRQYYLHNFLTEQPDLNFHNPRVRAEALSIARYWLERGVTGFRLDTVNFYCHDLELRNNPPSNDRGLALAPESNPYSYQNHLYDKNRPEVLSFLSELGALTREFPGSVTLGEVGAVQERSWSLIREYTSEERLNLCYNFDLLGDTFSAKNLRGIIKRSVREAPDAWPCWAFSNHDVARTASRLAPEGVSTEKIARLTMSILLSLRGTPCIYQGEELGLEEVDVPYDLLQDPYGIEFWPDYVGRDGCRTPMPWEPSEPNCGFTNSPEAWLPIPDGHQELAVSVQEASSQSTLHFFRRVLALRQQEPCLQLGTMTLIDEQDDVFAISRAFEGVTIQCHYNLSFEPIVLENPGLEGSGIFDGSTATWRDASMPIVLDPWQWAWLKMPPE